MSDERNPQAKIWLSRAYRWRGVALDAWGDSWGAKVDLTEALRIAEPNEHGVLKLLQWSLSSNENPRDQRIRHADRLARRGKFEAVQTLMETLAKETLTAAQTYNVVCVASLCSMTSRQDSRLTPEQQARQAEQYATQAMALLRQAIEHGYKDAAHIAKDPDLDPLRGREDFKKLLESLPKSETPPKP